MKNLYRFLAFIMFVFFVVTTGAYFLNKEIDTTVKTADDLLAKVTEQYSETLKDAKIKHNLYFVNCFPNVCAKGSFARYEKTTLEVVDALNKEEQPVKEKAKTDKYDVGSTEILIAKINPITKTVSLERGANNFLLLKNNKKIGSAYFKDLSLKKDLNLSDDRASTGNFNLNVNLPKLSYNESRVKASSLKISKEVYGQTDSIVSSKLRLNLKEFAIDNDENLLDIAYDVDLVNVNKQVIEATANFAKARIEGVSKGNKASKESINAFLSFATVLVDTFRAFDENKSVIKINNLHLKEHNVKTKKSSVDMQIKADITLNADLNPVGFITISVKPNGEQRVKEAEELTIVHPVTGARVKLLTKAENGKYVSDIKFADGKVIVNEQEIDINGQVKAFLDFAIRMLNLMSIQNMATSKL